MRLPRWREASACRQPHAFHRGDLPASIPLRQKIVIRGGWPWRQGGFDSLWGIINCLDGPRLKFVPIIANMDAYCSTFLFSFFFSFHEVLGGGWAVPSYAISAVVAASTLWRTGTLRWLDDPGLIPMPMAVIGQRFFLLPTKKYKGLTEPRKMQVVSDMPAAVSTYLF